MGLGLAGLLLPATRAAAQAQPALAQPVQVQWLDPAPPAIASGVSFGVPWAKGAMPKDRTFALTTADGTALPVQSWPMAYWADGSVKWTGFATAVDPNVAGPLRITPGGSAPNAAAGVRVTSSPQSIAIDTGWLQCTIPTSGANLFDSMIIGGAEVARAAHLECILQNGPENDLANPPSRTRFTSNIEKVTVEQSGPVRAVVKIEGKHKSPDGSRQWLPFAVRLYFFAGTQQPVRMVHTIFFDGDEKKDFIHGLGLVVTVPFREELQNRHVRFGGDEKGIWAEPVQSVNAWGGTQPAGRGAYPNQLRGQRMPNKAEMGRGAQVLESLASWGEFRLIQPNAAGFTIEKATTPQAAWIPAASGHRSSGYAFIGDVSGGLGVGLKDFWQAYPGELEVRNARSNAAELRVWMWAPDVPAMDLRHYDTVAHPLSSTYEDSEEDLSTSTPFGVARTHELTLFPTTAVPDNAFASAQAQSAARTPLLVASNKYLASVGAFGIWPVEDRSTPLKTGVAEYLHSIMGYYQKQIDQHNWYGFWDYGDVMHSYDEARHEWKYDFGGTAWDNSEQGTDMVFWYMYLYSQDPTIFRMAEAMSRHTGEVDSYHFGPLAGLGSRHNVRHWGCGAKEARISMAPYRRYYYYLTTDERTGDVMREMLAADESIKRVDPMRKADPITDADKQYPSRVRGGPDWFSLAGNWMTEWERTGDTKWRDKIYASFDSIAGFPHGFRTSRNLIWYLFPDSGKLIPRDPGNGGYNLVNQMGGPEIIFELNDMVDHPAWQKVWRDYCEGQGGRFAAYMYRLTKDPQYARQAMGSVTSVIGRTTYTNLQHVEGPEAVKALDEGPDQLVTNNVNQSTLNMMEVLAMIDDQLPANPPPPDPNRAGRGGRGARAGRGARGPATAPAPAN
jgi:hypothetical protein